MGMRCVCGDSVPLPHPCWFAMQALRTRGGWGVLLTCNYWYLNQLQPNARVKIRSSRWF
jgi:hypothetical protein